MELVQRIEGKVETLSERSRFFLLGVALPLLIEDDQLFFEVCDL